MGTQFAGRLNAVSPSVTLAMNARAGELRARGIDVFNFGVGEPDFAPPAHVLEAARAAVALPETSKYGPVSGILSLRQAIATSVSQKRGVPTDVKQVVVSAGAKHALYNLSVALFEAGNEVIVIAPYWVSYTEQIKMAGATPVVVRTAEKNGWRVDPADLERAITPATKAILLNAPSNPSGVVYSNAELERILEVAARKDLWVISDEIYGDLVYDGRPFTSAYAVGTRLGAKMILVDGVSKAYAMTGWRIGWTVCDPALAKACDMVQGQSTSNVAIASQFAALAALTGPQNEIASMRAAFEKRRGVMVAGLNTVSGLRCSTPDGAFYTFVNCEGLYGRPFRNKTIETDDDAALFLLEEAHVVTVPGGPFGVPGYLRFSYATSEERIRTGIEMLHAVLGKR